MLPFVLPPQPQAPVPDPTPYTNILIEEIGITRKENEKLRQMIFGLVNGCDHCRDEAQKWIEVLGIGEEE